MNTLKTVFLLTVLTLLLVFGGRLLFGQVGSAWPGRTWRADLLT